MLPKFGATLYMIKCNVSNYDFYLFIYLFILYLLLYSSLFFFHQHHIETSQPIHAGSQLTGLYMI